MQERQVTIGEETFPLKAPFLVLATQNPIEQEGTYPLPEAQVDRFMLKIVIDYPQREEELQIMRLENAGDISIIKPVIKPEAILRAQKISQEIYLDPKIENYILDLVFATRHPEKFGLEDLKDLISYGASPRASLYLARASKAFAFIRHRGYVVPEDIRSIGMDILRHRVMITYEAEAEEMTSEDIIQKIFDTIVVP
jgi:MoxR-like ATPase